MSMNGTCRGNKTGFRTSAGFVQISPHQQDCSWLTGITVVEGIPGRESKPLEMSCRARVDLWPRSVDPAQTEPPAPSWEQEEVSTVQAAKAKLDNCTI